MPCPRLLPEHVIQPTTEGNRINPRPWPPRMLHTITNNTLVMKRSPSKSAGGDGSHLLADCVRAGGRWHQGPGEAHAKCKRSLVDGFSPSTWGHWMTVLAFGIAMAGGLLAAEARLDAKESPSGGDQSSPSRKVALDLSKKEVYVGLPITADPEDVVITDVRVDDLPSEHALVPASGHVRLGHPLDIRLQEPNNVRVRLAVVKRGKNVALRVSPQILLGQNRAVELTQDRVTRAARNISRYLKHLNQHLAALDRERETLNLWLAAPGNKPLEMVQNVQMRLKILNRTVKSRKRDIPAVKRQCAAIAQAATFVRKLHDIVTIRYTVGVLESEGE